MTSQAVFLRQDAVVEPLVSQWYAWSYLVAPATSAMYVANHHIELMQSFIEAPLFHASALQNPAMAGGPFINHPADRVVDIGALLERTLRDRDPALRLAAALKELSTLLANEARGESLEPLYPRVPELLRGYVELIYDLESRPSYRLFEKLLYRSPYHDTRQQGLALSLLPKNGRAFAFITPRLPGPGNVHVPIAFAHPGVDELYRMKQEPRPLGHIQDLLGVPTADEAPFAALFTSEPPVPAQPRYAGEGVRVRYYGHACVLIESKDVTVLSDPMVAPAPAGAPPHFTVADLPKRIDYVVISHSHQDHCVLETLLELRHRIGRVVVPRNNSGCLADPSLKLVLESCGFRDVIELDALDELDIPGGSLTAVPFLGEHGDLDIRTKTAFLVRVKGRRVMVGADMKTVEPRLYEHLGELLHGLDALFIGMECVGAPVSWLYGPLLSKRLPRELDHSRRLDGSDFVAAKALVDQIRPRRVCVYSMGQEPWLSFVSPIRYLAESKQIQESDRLVAECREAGMPAERLYCQGELLL